MPNTGSLATAYQSNYSLEAWIRIEDLPPGTGISYDAAYAILVKQGFHEGLTINQFGAVTLTVWHNGDSGTGLTTPKWAIRPGQTHHVVGVVDRVNGRISVYVDGEHASTRYFTPGLTARTNTNPWVVGCAIPSSPTSDYGYPFKGNIQYVSIYPKA